MKLFGYLCLGGGPEMDFSPHFPYEQYTYSGQPVGPGRGRWKLDTDLRYKTMSIPSRDKQLQVFYNTGIEYLAPALAQLDSEEGENYKSKLRNMLRAAPKALHSDVVGIVNTVSTSTHHTLSLFTTDPEGDIHVCGLFDTQYSTTYLFWSTQPRDIQAVVDAHPLRFLIYRFPVLQDDVLFLRIEVLCAQWRDWMRKSQFSALLPFNALERRLFS